MKTPANELPGRVLVVRFSSLGDVVLTLPVFHALRRAYPGARLVALTKEAFADALRASPDIDEVLTLGKDESLASLTGRVRAQAFDAVLDLHANFRSRIVSALSGAPRVVRYAKAALARRLFVGLRVSSAELERHTLDRYMDAVRRLTGKEPKDDPAVLVIQTAFLGDAVLTTPLLGALRERFPHSRIDVLATPEVADVFRQHPAVAETLIFDKRGNEKSLAARWRLPRRKGYSYYRVPETP